ncbi:MAG: hypothetical protein KGL39_29520 [Patescibacteria group bacterium]|nr:hypothetical protein [Patescibacteria group bacterium]
MNEIKSLGKLMNEAGFDVWSTGGGCEAWGKSLPDDQGSLMICTDDQGIDGDRDAAIWQIGRYDQEGSFTNVEQTFTLAQALDVIRFMPVPLSVIFDTLGDFREEFAKEVANEFVCELKAALTPDQFAKMRADNATETSHLVCHSHDYLDANEIMAEAMLTTSGGVATLIDDSDETFCTVWNRAWEIALKTELTETRAA